MSSYDSQDKQNQLSFLLLQTSHLYRRCTVNKQCPFTADEITNATIRILDNVDDQYIDDRFAIIQRYMMFNGFLYDRRLILDESIEKLILKITKTTNYLKLKLLPLVQSYNRLGRDLKMKLAEVNLVESVMVD